MKKLLLVAASSIALLVPTSGAVVAAGAGAHTASARTGAVVSPFDSLSHANKTHRAIADKGVRKATNNTVVVTASDLASGFSDPNLATKWFFYNDENDTIDNSLGSFVFGPAAPPNGAGSAQMTVTGTQRRNIATYQFAGQSLANITTLSFTTYSPTSNTNYLHGDAYLNFNADFTGSSTSFQKRVAFVPAFNGSVVQGQWQTWDAINGGNAMWDYSGATWPAGIGGGGEPGTTLKSWSQMLSQYPNIRVLPASAPAGSWLGLRVGEPYNNGFTGEVGSFTLGTSSGTTKYVFEPHSSPYTVCSTGGDFTTIQAAVNAAQPGDTLNLCAGTYSEQVVVNKNLTITGAGKLTTTIASPGSPVSQTIDSYSQPAYSTFQVTNGATVTMSKVTVSGPTFDSSGGANCAYDNYGVMVIGGATLNLSNAAVSGATDSPVDGCQHGVDILVGRSAYPEVGHATITNVTATNYQKGGIVISGDGSTGTVTGSTVTGAPTNQIAANGVEVAFGATGTVSGNTITGNECNLAGACSGDVVNETQSTGIIIYDAATGVQATGNDVEGNDMGIYDESRGSSTVSGNTLSNNRYVGVMMDQGTAAVSGNTVASDGEYGIIGISYTGNTASSVDTVTSNVVTGNETGIDGYDQTGTGMVNLSGHYNRVVGNSGLSGGAGNYTAATMNLTNNWWGCNAGTGHPGCDSVTGSSPITTTPNLVLGLTGPSVAPGGTGTVTLDMTHNSSAADTSASGNIPDGTPVSISKTSGIGSLTGCGTSTVSGQATCSFTSPAGNHTLSNTALSATVDNQTVTGNAINKGTPTFSWAPHPLSSGNVLGPAQLDANASVPGTWAYSPGAGTVLTDNTIVHATFTPTDTSSYVGGSLDALIPVSPVHVIVTADNQTINAGDPMPSFTFQVSPIVPLSTLPTCTTNASEDGSGNETSAPGSYSITCSGGSGPKVVIDSYNAGTLTVNSAPASLNYKGPSSANKGSKTTVRALLTASDGAESIESLNGLRVKFGLDGKHCTGKATNSGTVSCKLKIAGATGSHTINVSFAGDSVYDAASTSHKFTVK